MCARYALKVRSRHFFFLLLIELKPLTKAISERDLISTKTRIPSFLQTTSISNLRSFGFLQLIDLIENPLDLSNLRPNHSPYLPLKEESPLFGRFPKDQKVLSRACLKRFWNLSAIRAWDTCPRVLFLSAGRNLSRKRANPRSIGNFCH